MRLDCACVFGHFGVSIFFMYDFQEILCTVQQNSCIVHGATSTLLKKKIKNRSYNTIHTFKNYFVTVFSVFRKIDCIKTD